MFARRAFLRSQRLMLRQPKRAQANTSTTFVHERKVAPPTVDDIWFRSVPFMRFYRWAGAVAVVLSCGYYYYDYRCDSERFYKAIREVSSANPAVMKGGMHALETILYHKQRSYGGVTTIKAGQNELINGGLIEGLMRAIARPNLEYCDRVTALQLLASLTKESSDARFRVANDSIEPLLNIMERVGLNERSDREALLAGATLLATLNDVDTYRKIRQNAKVHEVVAKITSRFKTQSALNLLIAERMEQSLKQDFSSLNSDLKEERKQATNAMIQSLLPEPKIGSEEMYSKIFDAAGIAVFGFVYGRARWFTRFYFAGTQLPARTLMVEAAKRSRIGVWLGGILLLDAAFSYGARDWYDIRRDMKSYGRDVDRWSLYQPVADSPARLVLPSFAAASTTILTLMAINRQRFVLLPLFVLMANAHTDVITRSQPYRVLKNFWHRLRNQYENEE